MSEVKEGEVATAVGVSFFLLVIILLACLKIAFVSDNFNPFVRILCGVIAFGVGLPLIFSSQARNYIVRLWTAMFLGVFILGALAGVGILLYGFFAAK